MTTPLTPAAAAAAAAAAVPAVPAVPVVIPATATTPAFTPLAVTPRKPVGLTAYEYMHAMALLPTNHAARISAADLRTALDPMYQVLMQLNEDVIKSWVAEGAITLYDSKGDPDTPYPEPEHVGDLLFDTDTARIVAYRDTGMWMDIDQSAIEAPSIPLFSQVASYKAGSVVWFNGVEYRAESDTTPPLPSKSKIGTFGHLADTRASHALVYPSAAMPQGGELALRALSDGTGRLRVSGEAPDGSDMEAFLAGLAVGDVLSFKSLPPGNDHWWRIEQYPNHLPTDEPGHLVRSSPAVYEFSVVETTAAGVAAPDGFSYIPSGAPDTSALWVEVRKDAGLEAKVAALVTGLEHGEAVALITNTPPAVAVRSVDELFIVGTTPTAEFVGHANDLALWDGTGWVFATPNVGETHLVESMRANFTWTTLGTWAAVTAAGGGPLVGEIVMWAGAGAPANYLLCDGGTFDGAAFPLLLAALGSTSTPDLTGQFIRAGAPDLAPRGFTTAMPRTAFGVTDFAAGRASESSGAHAHDLQTGVQGHGGDHNDHLSVAQGNGASRHRTGGYNVMYSDDPLSQHSHVTNLAHGHSFTGGDAETAPDHVVLAFIIRAAV